MGASLIRDSSMSESGGKATEPGKGIFLGAGAPAKLSGRDIRSLLLMPLFGVLLLVLLWVAILTRLQSEHEATLTAGMHDTSSIAAAFSEYTLRELRDIDRTTWLVKAQFERDGLVNLPYLIRNNLVPGTGPIRVSVADSTGNVVASNFPFLSAGNIASNAYFRRHAANDTGALDISQRSGQDGSGLSVIEMSRRLNHGDGSFGGVVVVAVEPAYLADFYRESQLGPQGLLAVLGMDGVYRVRRSGERIDAAIDGSNTPMYTAAVAMGEGSYIRESGFDRVRRLTAYRKLVDYPLIIVVGQAENEVMADYDQHRDVYLIAGTVASLLIFVCFAANTLLGYRARRSAVEVHRQQAFLQAVVDNMPVGIVARTMKEPEHGKIVVWNPAAEFVFGLPAKDVLGKTVSDVHSAEYARQVEVRDAELLASPMVQDFPQVLANVPGLGQRLLRIVRAPIFDMRDRVETILSIMQDITAEELRADALRLHAKVFEMTADAIVISDAQDRVIAVNAAFTRLTGFRSEEMLGRPMLEAPFGPSDMIEYEQRLETLNSEGRVSAEVVRYRKDGTGLPCWLTKSCVCDDSGALVNYLRVFTDISKLKDAQTKLEQLANDDPLTGLLNRRMFHDRLDLALRRAGRGERKVGLLFMDLDRFKRVNDVYGHDAGDTLLREVAHRLHCCVRGSDSLCRLGGDEFTIVVEDAELPHDAVAIAERIAEALKLPIDIGGHAIECRASIGIAVYPDHAVDAESLYKRADLAMYRAKHHKRPCWAVAGRDLSITALEKTGT